MVYVLSVLLTAILLLLPAAVQAGVPAVLLTFDRAKNLVEQQNGTLLALTDEAAAAAHAVRQAGAFPNPELELGAEDYGRAEVQAAIVQPLPLGGRRAADRDVARKVRTIAELRLESARTAVRSELTRRYTTALAAHQRFVLTKELVGVSSAGLREVSALVEAGAAMDIDLVRAEMELEELVLSAEALKVQVDRANTELAALWGESEPDFDGLAGELEGRMDPPSFEVLRASMESAPAWALAGARVGLGEAELVRAKKEAFPEIAVSGGYLQNNEADEGAVLLGLSIGLPVFNRNRGEIAEKTRLLSAGRRRADVERLEQETALKNLLSGIRSINAELDAISDGMLDRAEKVHTRLSKYYRQGKVGLLDVLEARTHLLALRIKTTDLLEERAHLAADIEELSGHPIEIIRQGGR
jgi:cobalt-zinc-cadmium efflux system outer membrane protein